MKSVFAFTIAIVGALITAPIAAKEVKIGVFLGFTGPIESLVADMAPGAELAIKEVSDEMIEWKTAGTRLYQQLPTDCHASLREVEPLRAIPENRPVQEDFYKTLEQFKRNE